MQFTLYQWISLNGDKHIHNGVCGSLEEARRFLLTEGINLNVFFDTGELLEHYDPRTGTFDFHELGNYLMRFGETGELTHHTTAIAEILGKHVVKCMSDKVDEGTMKNTLPVNELLKHINWDRDFRGLSKNVSFKIQKIKGDASGSTIIDVYNLG